MYIMDACESYETVSINYAYYLWINGFFTGIALCMFSYMVTYAYTITQNIHNKTHALKLPIDIRKICEEINKIHAVIEHVAGIICEQYEEYKVGNAKQQPFGVFKLLNLFINIPQHTK